MRYVQRDDNGKVIGHFACQQTYAKELLPDDHPDIKDYVNTFKPKREPFFGLTPEQRLEILEQKMSKLEEKLKDR